MSSSDTRCSSRTLHTNARFLPRHEQLILRRDALREELHTEVDRMLNDVIKFKIHIQKNLDDYEGFVTDELEKELGSEEMKDDTRVLDV